MEIRADIQEASRDIKLQQSVARGIKMPIQEARRALSSVILQKQEAARHREAAGRYEQEVDDIDKAEPTA